MNSKFDFELLKCIATDEGWGLYDPQPDKYYLRFFKDEKFIDIWFKSGILRLRNRKDPHHVNQYYREGDLDKIIEIFKTSKV